MMFFSLKLKLFYLKNYVEKIEGLPDVVINISHKNGPQKFAV